MPNFLDDDDYYPGMCRVDNDNIVTEGPPKGLDEAMKNLLHESNIMPTAEARVVADLWGKFKHPVAHMEEYKQAPTSRL